MIEHCPSNSYFACSNKFSMCNAKHDTLTRRPNNSVVRKIDRFAEQMALLHTKMGQALSCGIKNEVSKISCFPVRTHDFPTKMKFPHFRNAG